VTPHRPELLHPPSNLLGGSWVDTPGEGLTSRNPARPGQVVWTAAPHPAHVDDAVAAARDAAPRWAGWPPERRAAVLRDFAALASSEKGPLAALIRDEVGKPAWDAAAEADLLPSKVAVTLDHAPHGPLHRVTGYTLPLSASRTGRCWFRPHGVMAVIGPFNFPAHLPNGHIVPALLLGNTIVFKPSDKAPAVGQKLAELFDRVLRAAGAPPGVFNLVQGGADVATALVSHPDIDGVLFTGSWPVGRSIMQANLDRPGRILALEMGGNNPAIILPDADPRQALAECVRSAFVTAGQRCTCTRRLILHKDAARLLPALCKAASALIVGDPAAAHPVFMGPVISAPARDAVLAAQAAFARAGGDILVPCAPIESEPGGWFLSPGVMRVDRFTAGDNGPGADREVFGPFLRVSIADSLDDALAQANATQFGLAASIFTRDDTEADHFLRAARAGCLNVNTGTAGASGKLPFGGLGRSGNHRPAGAFAVDYCAVPVAGMHETSTDAPLSPGMHLDPAWLP
jgi:succinylglutamic semialdehyde dehydrogenase